MSFVRMPPRPWVISSKSGGSYPVERPRKPRKKPEWDDTVQDLNVHKASPDELQRRKRVSQSTNLDQVKNELLKKQIARAQRGIRTPGSTKKKRHHDAFLREVLHNHNQLNDALAKSDKVMAVVKDIFGDNPMKYHGLPNITTAPGNVPNTQRLPDGRQIEGSSKLDILSETMMDQSALNDLEDKEYESCSDEGVEVEGLNYQSVLDVARFQRLLQLAEKEEERLRGQSASLLTHSMAERALQKTLDQVTTKDTHNMAERALQKTLDQITTENKEEDWLARDDTMIAGSPEHRLQTGGAINDTAKVKRTMARTEQGNSQNNQTIPDPPVEVETNAPLATGPRSEADLQTVLQRLEGGVMDLERQTGRQNTGGINLSQNTFSSYTTALVTTVTKLTTYLKECELKLRAETTIRDQLSQDVSQLKTIVNALTSDIILTQEEYGKLRAEFDNHKRQSDMQINTLQQTLVSRGIEVPPVLPIPRPAFELNQNSDLQNGPTAWQPEPSAIPRSLAAPLPVPSMPQPSLPVPRQMSSAQSQPPAGDPSVGAATALNPPRQIDSPARKVIPIQIQDQEKQTTRFSDIQHIIRQQQQQQLAMQHKQQQQSIQPQQQTQEHVQQDISVHQQNIMQQHRQQQQSVPQQQTQDRASPTEMLGLQNRQTGLSQVMQGIIRQQQYQQQQLKTGSLASGQSEPETESIEDLETGPLTEEEEEMTEVQRQLAELNRQHAEAQSKLHYILQQQEAATYPGMPSTDTRSRLQYILHQQTAAGTAPHTVQEIDSTEGKKRVSVSPAISPIPPLSESSISSKQSNPQARQQDQKEARVIRVSIPRVETIQDSPEESLPQPRRSLGSRAAGPPGVTRKAQMTQNATGWFALSSHVKAS